MRNSFAPVLSEGISASSIQTVIPETAERLSGTQGPEALLVGLWVPALHRLALRASEVGRDDSSFCSSSLKGEKGDFGR
jgi:hypothetical protein